MSRRAQENFVAGVIIVVFLGVIAVSLGYGPRARMVPIPVAVFGLVLTLIQLVWQNLRPTTELQVDLLEVLTRRSSRDDVRLGSDHSSANQAMPAHDAAGWRKEIIAYGMVAAFLGLILLLGPIPAVFLFTGGYFMLSRHYSRLKALVYTVAFTATLYLLFVVALEVQLYHGVLEPIVSRF